MKHYHLPVSPYTWSKRFRTLEGYPVAAHPKAGITMEIPVSEKPDPNAGPKWLGYVTGSFKKRTPILGSRLVFKFQILCDGCFNFKSDEHNNGTEPAAFRPFLKKNSWDMMGAVDRWWSAARFELKNTPDLQTLDVSLEPSEWTQVDGFKASYDEHFRSDFKKTLEQPSFYGVTFGGGSFYGHGVNVCGKATFNLYSMYSY